MMKVLTTVSIHTHSRCRNKLFIMDISIACFTLLKFCYYNRDLKIDVYGSGGHWGRSKGRGGGARGGGGAVGDALEPVLQLKKHGFRVTSKISVGVNSKSRHRQGSEFNVHCMCWLRVS